MSDAAENENAHGKRQAMQNWELFPCYLPSSLWENFQKAANMVSALDILLVWLLQLGIEDALGTYSGNAHSASHPS